MDLLAIVAIVVITIATVNVIIFKGFFMTVIRDFKVLIIIMAYSTQDFKEVLNYYLKDFEVVTNLTKNFMNFTQGFEGVTDFILAIIIIKVIACYY